MCDLTQSWSAKGGGVRSYLLEKRRYILEHTGHAHLLIIPGEDDRVETNGRATTVTVRSPKVPGSPNYRLLLRNRAVRAALEKFSPDVIECQDVYNLPWAAVGFRRANPHTALVATFMTDMPTAYLERYSRRFVGPRLAGWAASLGYRYLRHLFGKFDCIAALSEAGGAAKLRALGLDHVEIMPLGVDIGGFSPALADPELRASRGIPAAAPLLIYAGRLDSEKRPDLVVEAFQRLPEQLGAHLVLLGDGPLATDVAALGNPRIHLEGFVADRSLLARWLASADIYVSGMADETFGVSIVEAQASGLPVVGVAAGAMIDRVDPAIGRLGPVGDADAMADNIQSCISHRAALGAAARLHATSFTWAHTMDALFGAVIPTALENRDARLARAAHAGFTRAVERV